MYFESKKDRWIAIILWTMIVAAVFIPLLKGYLIHAIWMMLLCGALLWFWFRTGYKIDKDRLIIYYGPIRQTIYIKDIDLIRLSKMPIISPALSFDRVQIRSGKYDMVSISPKDKWSLVEELIKINANMTVDKRLIKEK